MVSIFQEQRNKGNESNQRTMSRKNSGNDFWHWNLLATKRSEAYYVSKINTLPKNFELGFLNTLISLKLNVYLWHSKIALAHSDWKICIASKEGMLPNPLFCYDDER